MVPCLLGIDVGSSSIKAALVSIDSGKVLGSSHSPSAEMAISALQPGWAEQEPEDWWENVVIAVRKVLEASMVKCEQVKGIGIAYQMHGLVCVDEAHRPLRPSIIWCDSRATSIGNRAWRDLGSEYCLKHLLNSPGNFTASKLRWVAENEPERFRKIYKFMLPGDFIAMKLTGSVTTTASGLSEGSLWDFENESLSNRLLEYYEIPELMVPEVIPTFSNVLSLQKKAAAELGLVEGTPVSYRAGDQPNNAFALNVLNPGEVAATAGTSGVIYAVTDQKVADAKSRVNTFLHVNHDPVQQLPRFGVLLCINGAGILNSWIRKLLSAKSGTISYNDLNQYAAESPVGAKGMVVIPFGNGSERILENKLMDATLEGLNFNVHSVQDIARAVQEGIVFAMKYGFEIIEHLGPPVGVIKAGHANMFQSEVFCEAFVNTIGTRLELYHTDGAVGAALGAGVGIGCFKSNEETFRGLEQREVIEPTGEKKESFHQAYATWLQHLNRRLRD